MKYIKTFDNLTAYNADKENFEYPHVSYILSGDSIIYDSVEPAPEQPTRILVNYDPVDEVEAINMFPVDVVMEIGYYADYMPVSEYSLSVDSCIIGGVDETSNVEVTTEYEHYMISTYAVGQGTITLTIDGNQYTLQVDVPVE